MLTMGSLFDGIGGFPLAAVRNGITPIWASEIEKFPMEVTKFHFPDMLHLGDIKKINGAEIPVVDIICGGSPCQDLSVASGNRKGLAGERSGLFMEQIRIIKEMRKRMRKVAEQLSLYDHDMQFGKMFQEHSAVPRARISRRSSKNSVKFTTAPCQFLDLTMGSGNLLGQSFWTENLALLGEYWILNSGESPKEGVESTLSQILEASPHPKYYLSKTACLGILRRAKLREKELPPQLETALKIQAELVNLNEITTEKEELEKCNNNKSYYPVLNDQGGERMDITDNMVGTLRASMGGNLPVVLASTKPNAEIAENLSPTLTASGGGGGGNIPLLYDNNAQDCRYNGPLEIAPTITASYGTGGTNTPLWQEKSYCIAANTINREPQNGGNGLGVQEDVSYTLTTSDIPAVATFEPYQKVVGALMHRDHKGVNTCYVNQDKCIVEPKVFGQSSYGGYDTEVSTLTASGGYLGGCSENLSVSRNLVRRLTPLECERLQGFPDNWTNIEKAADSPRYKALGNSVSIPVVEFVMKGVSYFLKKQYEME